MAPISGVISHFWRRKKKDSRRIEGRTRILCQNDSFVFVHQPLKKGHKEGDFRDENIQQMKFLASLECLKIDGSRAQSFCTFWNGSYLCISKHQTSAKTQTYVKSHTSFPKHKHFGVLEWLLISHSRMMEKGDKRPEIVLVNDFFNHSGMPGIYRFRNTWLEHIPEPLSLPSSGIAQTFAFWNIKYPFLTEHTLFLKHKSSSVQEPSLIGYSGMPKMGD